MRERLFPQYFVETSLRIIPQSEPFDYPAYLCRSHGDSEVFLAYLDDDGSWWKFRFGFDRLIDSCGNVVQFIKRQYP